MQNVSKYSPKKKSNCVHGIMKTKIFFASLAFQNFSVILLLIPCAFSLLLRQPGDEINVLTLKFSSSGTQQLSLSFILSLYHEVFCLRREVVNLIPCLKLSNSTVSPLLYMNYSLSYQFSYKRAHQLITRYMLLNSL